MTNCILLNTTKFRIRLLNAQSHASCVDAVDR